MNGFSRKVLATLLVPVCLMCAGCYEFVTENTDTQSEAGTEKSVTDCADYDSSDYDSHIRECELKLRDVRRSDRLSQGRSVLRLGERHEGN